MAGVGERGWGPPVLQRSRSPFPGAERGEGVCGCPAGAASRLPCPGELRGHPAAKSTGRGPRGDGGSATGEAEGLRNGGMDEWRRDNRRRDGGVRDGWMGGCGMQG